MARTGAVGETSTIKTRHGRGSPLSLNKLWPILGRSHRMMNEIPTKNPDRRTHGTFSDGWSEEIEGGFRSGQLAKFEAARPDESATRAGKARWKVFGSSRCVAMHNSGARPRR